MKLAAIAHERVGYEEFVADYWNGEMYFDPNRETFMAANSKKGGMMMLLSSFSRQKVAESKAAGVAMNFTGDGWQLGAELVFGPGDTGLEFVHREAKFGDHATPEEILEAVHRFAGDNGDDEAAAGASAAGEGKSAL